MNASTVTRHEVTRLLQAIEREPDSLERLTELVYDDIRRLAHHQQPGASRSPTLQTTALVHEAFLKVFDRDLQQIENRQHLIRLMGCAMRQIIVDHARSRLAQKRGGDRTPSGTDPDDLAGNLADARQVLDVERAFQQLERLDPDLAELVAAHFSPATPPKNWPKARVSRAAPSSASSSAPTPGSGLQWTTRRPEKL